MISDLGEIGGCRGTLGDIKRNWETLGDTGRHYKKLGDKAHVKGVIKRDWETPVGLRRHPGDIKSRYQEKWESLRHIWGLAEIPCHLVP